MQQFVSRPQEYSCYCKFLRILWHYGRKSIVWQHSDYMMGSKSQEHLKPRPRHAFFNTIHSSKTKGYFAVNTFLLAGRRLGYLCCCCTSGKSCSHLWKHHQYFRPQSYGLRISYGTWWRLSGAQEALLIIFGFNHLTGKLRHHSLENCIFTTSVFSSPGQY